jgi:hypothetical protein
MRGYGREEAEKQLDELIDRLRREGPFSVQVDGKDAAILARTLQSFAQSSAVVPAAYLTKKQALQQTSLGQTR